MYAPQAAKVMIKIRQATGSEAATTQLFRMPTIAGLAAVMQSTDAGWTEVSAIPSAEFSPEQRLEGVPCSANQEQMAVLFRMQPESAAYNMSSAVRLLGRLDVAALEAALVALSRRHEILRTRLLERDGGLWQAVLPEDHPQATPLLQRHSLPGGASSLGTVQERVERESGRPFKLMEEVPLRFCLFELAPKDAVLLAVFHHAISDGASMAIFLEELAAAYSAAVAGLELSLPPLPIQYADFAAWQAARLVDGQLDKQLDYWKQNLAGAPLLLELPTDYARPAEPSGEGASVPVLLDAQLTRRLRHLASTAGATIFMVLLAAWQVLVHLQCQQVCDVLPCFQC